MQEDIVKGVVVKREASAAEIGFHAKDEAVEYAVCLPVIADLAAADDARG